MKIKIQTVFLFPLVFFLSLVTPGVTQAQCFSCSATTFTVNLSTKADTAWVLTNTGRSGSCCSGMGSSCIKFVIFTNPGSDLISFDVTNPAPSGSGIYQIDCGATVTIGQP